MPEIDLLNHVPAPAGWTAVAFLLLWLGRGVVLKGRDDINTLKAGGVLAEGLDSLHKRVIEMDARINKLERDKARLVVYCNRCLIHFSNCGGCAKREAERAALREEFSSLMSEINQ